MDALSSPARFWTMPEVCTYIRKSDSWIYARLQRQRTLGIDSLFPRPVLIGRSTLFVVEEIVQWTQKTIDECRNAP
jgi:predicted DNA-binding transcriptional regulator AlpA